jgi:hypothetical protein
MNIHVFVIPSALKGRDSSRSGAWRGDNLDPAQINAGVAVPELASHHLFYKFTQRNWSGLGTKTARNPFVSHQPDDAKQ